MSWAVFHSESEALALAAHEALSQRQGNRAIDLFRRAAEAEEKALGEISPDKLRTFAITAISAVALWYKAGEGSSRCPR
jgi:hypothetical protein